MSAASEQIDGLPESHADRRALWLAERRTGIGSSDAAAAVGMSKWKTPLELYLDKRGELQTQETEPMRWGTLLEPVVRQEYCNRTGRTVTVPGRILRHHARTFAIVNLDGIADGHRVYEGKTARTGDGWGEPGSADIPVDYLLQVQHAMFVAGLEIADVAVLIGGQDFRIYHVPADVELQEMLLDQEAAFWAMVQSGTPPAPVNRDDVKRRWRVSSGATIHAQPNILKTAEMLAAVKEVKRAAEAREDELAAVIQEYMGEAAELVAGESTLATWKNINAAPKFDVDAFKADRPDLWKEYLREPAPRRQFLLKTKASPKTDWGKRLEVVTDPKLIESEVSE